MGLEIITDRVAGLIDAVGYESGRGLFRRMASSTADPLAVEAATKRYIIHRLRADLGLEKTAADDDPESDRSGAAETRVEMPLQGVRSLIRFVHFPERSVTLRVYPPAERFEATLHRQAARTLEQHGLNSPRLLAYVDEPARYGVIFVVEEFLRLMTVPSAKLDAVTLGSLGTQLARLHSVHSNRWGALEKPRRENFFSPLMRRINRYISAARTEDVAADNKQYALVHDWFRGHGPALRALKNFSLTHGKLHAGNGLFSKAGEFCFLDYTTLEWSVPLKDVIQVRRSICGGLPEKITLFEQSYLPPLSPEAREMYDEFRDFYDGLYLLTSVCMRTKRMKVRAHLPREERAAERRKEWEELIGLVTK